MSFTSSAFRLRAVALVGCLSVAALACDHPTTQDVTLGNPPAPLAPLGPTPGPHVETWVATNPFPHDVVTRNAGRLYFLRYNCAGCHGDHAGGGMGPSLRDGAWIYGNSEAQIFDSIAQGRAHGMPAWGTKLPDEVVWKLVAYIQSLRTPDEPSPADQSLPRSPVP
jgi:cytochrome c oxidase cbb3-type subunit 3